MKRAILALLSVLILVGCYEKDPIPEGLTADNFYIGTFTFTDFADGEKPESYTVVTTKDTITISDSNGKVYIDNEKFPTEDQVESRINFENAKNFSFAVDVYTKPMADATEFYSFVLTGNEKGVSLSFSHYDFESSKQNIFAAFSSAFTNGEDFLPPKFDSARYPQTLEWNGKRYKSTLKAAFEK